MRLVFDIEADNLLYNATKMHCIVAQDLDTQAIYVYRPNQLEAGIELLAGAELLVAHNCLNYDIPLIKKLYPGWDYVGEVHDTFVMSSLYRPDLGSNGEYRGIRGHSIEAWGQRFGQDKVQNEDWQVFTEHMLERCIVDVEICHKVYQELLKIKQADMRDDTRIDWDKAYRLEARMASLMQQQAAWGFYFDVQKCQQYIRNIDSELQRLDKKLLGAFPPHVDRTVSKKFAEPEAKDYVTEVDYKVALHSWVTQVYEQNLQFTYAAFNTNGSLNANCCKYFELAPEQAAELVGGPFCRVEFRPFNYNSVSQLKDYMLARGWKPKQKTDKGNPQVTEEELIEMLPNGVGKDITLRNNLSKVRSKLENPNNGEKGLLNWVRSDHRIPAVCIPQATNTGRGRHVGVANIPKINKDEQTGEYLYYPAGDNLYGTEMRELFCAAPGKVLVGVDAAGLELRMLAHYLNDPVFTDELLNADIHTKIWQRVKDYSSSRSKTKNLTYGLLYSAGNYKLGKTADLVEIDHMHKIHMATINARRAAKGQELIDEDRASCNKCGTCLAGEAIRTGIMDAIDGFESLIERVAVAAKAKGYLIGLDGRRLTIRSPRAGLNLLLQSAGSLVFKVAIVAMYNALKAAGLWGTEARLVAFYHDEYILEVSPGSAEAVKEICENSIRRGGEFFKLNCPLAGEAKVGQSWKEVH